ncbi:MAG: sulfotransferase [Alphaproteobacteria bacterium]|nr:sulfotransferase [Alphaproteobacteria bacterium]
MTDFNVDYTALDRLLHEAAFAAPGIQRAVADIEDALFSKRIRNVNISKPVFIASLPRAGTTLLLETLSELPEFASHTYRDMPFLLCPMWWDKISAKFRKTAHLRERAHEDGIKIGYDSPEAFEEILWRAFWPKRYKSKSFSVWPQEDDNRAFESFFRNHIRKIIALRRPNNNSARYISKNNANIIRIKTLAKMFPDGTIFVPFRQPFAHADSLQRMHVRFEQLHKEQPFSQRYMEHLGHYEFGKTLRPINFDGWLDASPFSPNTANFWLSYWIAAFRHLLENKQKNMFFFSYEKCCADPKRELEKLADILMISQTEKLLSQAEKYRAPRQFELPNYSAPLKEEAMGIYRALLDNSIT